MPGSKKKPSSCRRSRSQKRRGLPGSIVKQYGVTKKAWSVFRSRCHPKKR